jgi:hypothetical protein
MNDDRYVEYGAATGILFVVLAVIGFAVVIPTPPDLNAPSQEWSSYFLAHHGAVRAGIVLLAVGMFAFIWFLGTLTSVLRIATGTPRLPSIAFAGGILGAGSLLFGLAALAVAAYRPQGVDPLITRALNDVFVLSGVAAIPAFTALFAATALVILRSGAFPGWLAWLLVAAAVVQPLTFGALFTKHGAFAGDGALGLFVPLVVSFVAIFALSALLTAWARNAAQAGNPSLTERIRGAVSGAATGARVGAREGRTS